MQNHETKLSDSSVFIRWAFIILQSVFLITLCWFAHFSYFRQMGFYEDDHWFAARTIGWSPLQLWGWIWDQIRLFPNPQGRPIGFILGDVIPHVCYHLGGVPAMFVAGWMIFSANTILLYSLLYRCVEQPLPLIGAIGFMLFPADTTRPFLCHAHILQPSITFMLIGCHLYLSRRWTSYLFACCSLLTYETALLPFVIFPLLNRDWDIRWIRRFAVHLLIMATIGGGFFLIRKTGGESRVLVADTTRQAVLEKIWTGTGIGLNTVLKVSQSRAGQGLDDYDLHRVSRQAWVGAAIAMGATVFINGLNRRRGYQWLLFVSAGRAAAFAAAGLGIAYLFCFTHYPPFYEEGRLTSTHLAATLPWAVLVATLVVVPIIFLPRIIGPLVCGILAGIYFTALFSSARDEQIGYVQIWQARQQLWTRVIDLCPDMTDSTLIAMDGFVAQPAYYMGTAAWSDFLVLGQMYDFSPSHFHRDPIAAHFKRDTWKTSITAAGDGKWIWTDSPFGVRFTQPFFDHNLILLHTDEYGHVTRQFGTIDLGGRPFHLKDTTDDSKPFPKLPLYIQLTHRL